MGFGERGDRPDQLGLLLAPLQDNAGRLGVLASETRPGGARTERANTLVQLLRKRATVLLAEHTMLAPGIGATLVTELEPERSGPIRERARSTLADRAHRRRGARR
jgi:hypothetical protein